MKTKLYQAISRAIEARETCEKTGNTEWHNNHTERAGALCENYMPSGSGVDSGTQIDWTHTTAGKMVFITNYHHMNDGGMYDGWTGHTITVKPSLMWGFELSIGGRDRNGIKDYLGDLFHEALNTEVEEYPMK